MGMTFYKIRSLWSHRQYLTRLVVRTCLDLVGLTEEGLPELEVFHDLSGRRIDILSSQ